MLPSTLPRVKSPLLIIYTADPLFDDQYLFELLVYFESRGLNYKQVFDLTFMLAIETKGTFDEFTCTRVCKQEISRLGLDAPKYRDLKPKTSTLVELVKLLAHYYPLPTDHEFTRVSLSFRTYDSIVIKGVYE